MPGLEWTQQTNPHLDPYPSVFCLAAGGDW
jgi:hypothetical protein